ncbi:MAG: hypothetical protein KJ623_00575, partial [Nanoarchaeota archaeon]|nr:hypothetical protein [Nanoarchaeota archaeon]
INHIRKGKKNIQEKYPKLYEENKETIDKLIIELHEWFDQYSKPPLAQKYGYIDRTKIRHRRELHHIEGIRWAEDLFTKKYGEDFRNIILEESKIHVIDDMGKILEMGDYYVIGFWN